MWKHFHHRITNVCNSKRSFSSNVNIFNEKIKRLQRDRSLSSNDSELYDYLKDEIAFRVADRIFDIKR